MTVVIPGGLARSFRAVARRCRAGRPRGPAPPVGVAARGGTLILWTATAEAYAPRPVTLAVRETRFAVARPGFRVTTVTLVSTLLDATAYPADALAGLYRQRWQVETDLAHLKTTLGMDVLKCTTEAGVAKELVAFAIAYNLVRAVMLEASRRQKVPVSRISFVDALRWLASSPPGTPLPTLVANPERKDRVEPRCQKRRAKKYPYMIRPRAVLRKKLLEQQVPA